MAKTIVLQDIISGMPCDAVIIRGAVSIGPVLISAADILKLAQEVFYNGPKDDLRDRFFSDISGSTIGDGPFGTCYRPAVERQIAGTQTGF